MAGDRGLGLGAGGSTGTPGLIPPTLDITHTGQEEVLDEVRIVFQMTPGTECPAEMNFSFPAHGALCMAENATHNLHNLLTRRGAQVRDPRTWARYLDEAIELFAGDTEVAFASHHWPTWGTDAIVDLSRRAARPLRLSARSDAAADQPGLRRHEIAELIELPPALEQAWHTHGYYGSVNHNVKAIYQRYIGWYYGNPAHLWKHPPEAAGARYVQAMGGLDATVAKVREFFEDGDLRFAAELASHAVFAAPDDHAAPRAPGDRPRAARLRLGERHVAERLPHRRARAAHRHRCTTPTSTAPAWRRADHHPAVRLRRHPHRRPKAWAGSLRSTGTSPIPTSTTTWS